MSFPKTTLALFALACLFVCAPAFAVDYVVSPAGNDSSTGIAGTPFKTITKGLSVLKPGDSLTIGPGAYAESCSITVKGTEQAPVIIKADPEAHLAATGRDGILVWQSSWVTIAGLKVTGASRAGLLAGQSDHITFTGCICGDNGVWGIQTSLSSHVTVQRCELYGSKKEHGVYFSTTDYVTVTDNHIHDNNSCGIHMNADASEGGDGIMTGCTIARNKILRCGKVGGAAINLDGVERSTIEANVLDSNLAGGIVSFKGDAAKAGARNKFLRNVVKFDIGIGRFGIKIADGSTRATLEGNTIDMDHGPAVELDKASARGFTASRNFYASPSTPPTFSFDGRTIDFSAWKDATGEDADSHVMQTPSKRAKPPEPAPAD